MAECEVDNSDVFKLFLLTIEGAGKLDHILHRTQVMIKFLLVTFKRLINKYKMFYAVLLCKYSQWELHFTPPEN